MTTTQQEWSTRQERMVIYIAVGAALVVLLVVAIVVHRQNESNQVAQQKANQFIAAVQQAGGRAPSQEQVIGLLGDDGGAVCADPNAALNKATLLSQLSNGAGGPGARPIIADRRFVSGAVLVIRIYCPDQLPAFQEFVDGMKYDETATT